MIRKLAAWAGVLAVVPAAVAGSEVQWSPSDRETVLAGEMSGVAVDPRGAMSVAPRYENRWGPDTGVVWAVVSDDDGGAYLGLSDPGRVVHVDADGAGEIRFDAGGDAWVTAITTAGETVLAGLSPGGRIVAIGPDGASEERIDAGAEYVWGLATDRGGMLWAATGSPGTVTRFAGDGTPEVMYTGGDDPVRCLVALPGGGVVAGTGRQGRVVRIDDDGRATVLFDADEEEIVAIASHPSGEIYALAASGGPAKPAPKKPAASTPPEAPRDARQIPAHGNGGGDGETGPASRAQTTTSGATTSVRVTATAPGGGGTLYRIDPSGDVVPLWNANGELPGALALDRDGRPWIGAGDKGRVYRVDRPGESTLIGSVPSLHVTVLARDAAGGVLVGASSDARLGSFGPQLAEHGRYAGRPIDAGWVADWGRVRWDGAERDRAEVAVRTGNTSEPDDTWSDWFAVDGGDDTVGAVARFAQIRVEMTPGRDGAPSVDGLAVAYRTRNRAPLIGRLAVAPPGVAWARGPAPGTTRNGPLVADDPVARRTATEVGRKVRPGPIRKSYESGVRTFHWEARDPDGDPLRFRLEAQRVGDDRWFVLQDGLEDVFYSWDARSMPDGRYRARLTADDEVGNAVGAGLTIRRIGDPFVLDGTPPEIRSFDVRREPQALRVQVEVSDGDGVIATLEYALGDSPWRRVDPVDGVSDSGQEHFEVVLDDSAEGGQLRIRVTDRAGNVTGDVYALR